MGKERPPKVFYEEKTGKYYVKVGNKKIYLNVGKMTKQEILRKILSTFKVRQKNKKRKGAKAKPGEKKIPVENPIMNAMKNDIAKLISDANNGQVINLRQQNEDLKRRMNELEKEYKHVDFSRVKEELKKRDHAKDKKGLLEDKDNARYKGVAPQAVDVEALINDNLDRVPIGDVQVFAKPADVHKLRGIMNNKTDEKIGLENKVDITVEKAVRNKFTRDKLQKLVKKYKDDPEYKTKAIWRKSGDDMYEFLKVKNDKAIRKAKAEVVTEKKKQPAPNKKKKEQPADNQDRKHSIVMVDEDYGAPAPDFTPDVTGANSNDVEHLQSLMGRDAAAIEKLQNALDKEQKKRPYPEQAQKIKAMVDELKAKEQNMRGNELRLAQLTSSAPVTPPAAARSAPPVPPRPAAAKLKSILKTTTFNPVLTYDDPKDIEPTSDDESQIIASMTQTTNLEKQLDALKQTDAKTPDERKKLQAQIVELEKRLEQQKSDARRLLGMGNFKSKLLQFGNGLMEALKQTQVGGMYGPTSRVEINGYPADPPTKIVKTQPVIRPIKLQGKGTEKVRGLYSDEIDKMMAPYPNFLGTIAADEIKTSILPKIKKEGKGGFVINTDSRGQSGKHWFGVYFDATPNGSKSIEVYDSFGRDPDRDLLKDIKSVADKLDSPEYLKLKINKIVRQKDTTNTCGYMAAKFLVDRFKGIPFKECSGYNDSIRGEKDIKKVVDKYKKFGFI
jgi:hypothetical protein